MQTALSPNPTSANFFKAFSAYQPCLQPGGVVCQYYDLCREEQEVGDLISAGTAAGHPPAARKVRWATEMLAKVAEKASSCGPEVESVAKRALIRFQDHEAFYSGTENLTEEDLACVSAMVSAAIQNVLKSQDLKTKTKFTTRAKSAIARMRHLFKSKVSGMGKTVLGLCLRPTATA